MEKCLHGRPLQETPRGGFSKWEKQSKSQLYMYCDHIKVNSKEIFFKETHVTQQRFITVRSEGLILQVSPSLTWPHLLLSMMSVFHKKYH